MRDGPTAQRYEPTDFDPRSVGGFVGGLAIAVVLSGLFCLALVRFYAAAHPADSLVRANAAPLPKPEVPRLELNPPRDLREFREAEERKLNRYGWIDRGSGIAQIPIRRAMELLAQKGLPARPPGEKESAPRGGDSVAPQPTTGAPGNLFPANPEVPIFPREKAQ